jgi:hypothetical protein
MLEEWTRQAKQDIAKLIAITFGMHIAKKFKDLFNKNAYTHKHPKYRTFIL